MFVFWPRGCQLRYRELDSSFLAIFGEHEDGLFRTVATTKFPQTYRAMLGFCIRTNSLKAAILDALDSDNTYAFRVMHRCLCEHYLKFLYIWARFTHERSDVFANDYYRFGSAKEMHEGVEALEAAEPLLEAGSVEGLRKIVEGLYPESRKLERDVLDLQSDRFSCRSVLESLTNDDLLALVKSVPFLRHVIPTHVLLTPFVSAGPYTDIDMPGVSELQIRQECLEDVDVIVLVPAVMLMLTAVVISSEYPEHSSLGVKNYQLIKKSLAGGRYT
jgi:hypothetical protein